MNKIKIFNISKKWVKNNIKSLKSHDKKKIFKYLYFSYFFEKNMKKMFLYKKRFSIEGCDVLIPILYFLINTKKNIVVSMSHRGRLNVLYNIFNFNFFVNSFQDEIFHLGFERKYKKKKIIILPNPSHLEYSNCVSMGYTKSLFENGFETLNIQIHGDCAFSGQGIVMETLNLSKLKDFSINGTLHIIVNNEIGFTTNKIREIRSSKNSDSIMNMFNFPIFRIFYKNVNSVIKIVKLAVSYINKYKRDVLINLKCYRKLGHSEQDDPNITQPLEYIKIKNIKPLYKNYNIKNFKSFKEKFRNSFYKKKTIHINNKYYKNIKYINKIIKNKIYNLNKIHIEFKNKIKKIINMHILVKTFVKKRIKSFKSRKNIDWSTGEYIALRFLNFINVNIRFSGQDSQRGTFCQRHYNIYDQISGKKICIFNKRIKIINSPLSEASVLGFEIGYSICNLDNNFKSMNIWEAQFGDFLNCAQVYFDQYISSLKFKWNKNSNIILLLPHGIEGQGPEHSSSRIERILSLCYKKNIIVSCPNSSAQYFNCILQQFSNNVPNIILTKKKNIRSKHLNSNFSDFSGKYLKYKIINNRSKVCIICIGDIFYEIKKYKNLNIVLIEQLYPLDLKIMKKSFTKMKKVKKYFFVQKEPKNQGYWPYLFSIFKYISNINIKYLGSPKNSSTTFFGKKYKFYTKKYIKKIKTLNEKEKNSCS
ncbi:2-oxoglutarate dehydrogenase E1 component [Candidatus Vidania fulgoroideae]|uniref:oxoglutarate dehydrogenase (succinyl-transferring) n=1 Tax=Candidatus Vidania fulgoroideorum TaxID=881286 RepID=A0A346E0C7_9PROT|nr:2-oxoglutarate dehydrogenase E1 component [Candidatus Vidania fulgoroideae]